MSAIKKLVIIPTILMVGLLFILTACEKRVSGDVSDQVNGSCFGNLVGGWDEISSLKGLGSGWVRPHPGPFVWQWIEPSKGKFKWRLTDKWVKEAQRNDVSILGTIWPYADWDQEACHTSSCEVGPNDIFLPNFGESEGSYIPPSRCAPCNIDDYKEFLIQLVERYDGDGENDMPGLTNPIKYWEILNEPEMESQSLTFFNGSKEEYFQILKASYEAIKNACPDCQVLHGGAAGMTNLTLSYWEYLFDLGAGDYFDIANIHFLGGWDPATLNVKDFKNLLEQFGLTKPIWVTEAQFFSDEDMVSSIKGAMDAGASKVFSVGYGDFSNLLEAYPSICTGN